MNFAVLLAAGSSERFRQSGGGDKLTHLLTDGRPIWRSSFETLVSHKNISGVGIVCPFGRESEFHDERAAFVVSGGPTRSVSSLNGVRATPPTADIVLVHDAARPFVEHELIDRVLVAAEEFGAAIPAVPVSDTIKKGPDFVKGTLERQELFRAQTPQAAKRSSLLSALSKAPKATDEAMALEAAGYRVKLVPGDERNVKITTMADLGGASSAGTTLTGFGYDIHRFSDDPLRPLMLGGVHFPGHAGLEGHSDADVVLHAVTDAILGAAGLGDIGVLFPNTDPSWKNADSLVFLREAKRLAEAAGARIVNIDVTLLAETPKLGARRSEISERISQELGLAGRKINIKATTMEGLGAIGRSEGIAAMAVATLIESR